MTVLDDKIAQLQTDSDLVHQIVHGDALTTVMTDGGPVRSFAKMHADMSGGTEASASAAAASAQEAGTARDAAIAASQVATAPVESLAALSQSIHAGTVVRAFVYDTSKDSDGGAWRKRTSHASWYNEAINGAWLGQKANELAARGDNLWASPEGLISAFSAMNVTNAANSIIGYANSIQFGDNSVQRYAAPNSFTTTAGTLYAITILVQMDDNSAPVVNELSSVSTDMSVVLANVRVPASGITVTATTQPNVYKVVAVASSASASSSNGVFKYTNQSAKGFRVTAFKLNKVGELPSTYSGSPELVANGGFDSGTSGWATSPILASTATVVNGEMQVSTNTAGGRQLQAISVTVGKTYVLSGRARKVSGDGAASIGYSLNSNGTGITAAMTNTTATAVSGSITFNATQSTYYICAGDGVGSATSATYAFDSISVKEVTTLATPYVPYSALAGKFYQNTTDGKFYALNATYGQTETFRGNTREFPAVAAIIAEAARVVIYDLTKADCPMWMVFQFFVATGNNTSALALNGALHATHDNVGSVPLTIWDFVRDQGRVYFTTGNKPSAGGVSQRPVNSTAWNAVFAGSYAGASLVNASANDIAATILPGAPVDPATGLPVPTVAVHTSGGVSVIKDSGSVANHAFTGVAAVDSVAVAKGWLHYGNAANGNGFRSIELKGITGSTFAGTLIGSNIPAFTLGKVSAMTDAMVASSIHVTAGAASAGVALNYVIPSATARSMRAAITTAYNSGWQVGDARAAWLADIVAETLAASGELVANGTFDTDTSGWATRTAEALITWNAAGYARFDRNGGLGGLAAYAAAIPVAGRHYLISFEVKAVGSASHTLAFSLGSVSSSFAHYPVGKHTISLGPTTSTSELVLSLSGSSAAWYDLDNISVRLAEPDRSVKAKGLIINGSLAKSAVASGAQLVGYSGFSATNFFEQPYNADLDFGTGDFCVMGWVSSANNSTDQTVLYRGADVAAAGASGVINIWHNAGSLKTNIGGTRFDAAAGIPINQFYHFAVVRSAGVLAIYVNGNLIASNNNAASLTLANAFTRVGSGFYTGVGATLALMRISATAPGADQIAHIYRSELPLFQPNAQCAIAGNSTAVTALAYDEGTELLHVGTSWGRSAFKDLMRVESEATAVGSVSSIAASEGAVINAGTSARIYQPALLLRDELRRKAEARRALGKEPVFFDYDATTGQTAFVLPVGYTAKAVYSAGALKRSGSTKDYTTGFDGFRETVTFAVAPGNGVWVNIMTVRSN